MQKKLIRQFLMEIGISTSLSGYELMESAINLCLIMGSCKGISTNVYSVIASEHNATVKQVERNIRTAVEQAYNRGKLMRINHIFNSEICTKYECPTVKSVLSLGMLYVIQAQDSLEKVNSI